MGHASWRIAAVLAKERQHQVLGVKELPDEHIEAVQGRRGIQDHLLGSDPQHCEEQQVGRGAGSAEVPSARQRGVPDGAGVDGRQQTHAYVKDGSGSEAYAEGAYGVLLVSVHVRYVFEEGDDQAEDGHQSHGGGDGTGDLHGLSGGELGVQGESQLHQHRTHRKDAGGGQCGMFLPSHPFDVDGIEQSERQASHQGDHERRGPRTSTDQQGSHGTRPCDSFSFLDVHGTAGQREVRFVDFVHVHVVHLVDANDGHVHEQGGGHGLHEFRGEGFAGVHHGVSCCHARHRCDGDGGSQHGVWPGVRPPRVPFARGFGILCFGRHHVHT